MEYEIMNVVAEMGISDKFIFTGFLRGEELSKIFRMADIFVMPSISEPFGIAALESIVHGTPVILSKQTGVSEVVKNALKVDFWDTDEMANKILSVLSHTSLYESLKENSQKEVKFFSWETAAAECFNIYKSIV